MAMTKKDYEAQGRRDGAAHVAAQASGGMSLTAAPKEGTWQHRAYMDGFSAEVRRAEAGRRPDPKLSPCIDIEGLVEVSAALQDARRSHVRTLAQDHNAERRQGRRVRLYRAIGRVLDRAGIKQPIPTVTA